MLPIKTIFPWSIFPTEIKIIGNESMYITYTQLFTSQTEFIPLKEIRMAEYDTGLFFATLRLQYGEEQIEVRIPHLRKADAKLLVSEIMRRKGK